jgi:glycosyltransferase involved in cell wall biosynthesis
MVSNVGEKTLLVVSHSYKDFVKDQVDVLANEYKKIYVSVRYNPFASVSKYIPINYMHPHRKDIKINYKRKPDNVEIIETPLYYLPLKAQRKRLGFQHAWKLSRVLEERSREIDIVHSHLTWTAGYAGQKIADDLRVPHVLTIHENHSWFKELQDKHDKAVQVWERSDHLIRVNQQDIKDLQTHNDSVTYIPNGFNPELFEQIPQKEARNRLNISTSKRVLFSLGKLKERKGFQNIIKILQNIEGFNVMYYIGGDGIMYDKLKNLSEVHNVQDKVTLLGYLPKEEIKLWMSAADVFILPSYSESFGLVALEALACGTPVVTTENGGTEEIINRRCGIVVNNPESYNQLQEAIQQALRDTWDQDAIVDYAQLYTWKNVANKILQIHNGLLENEGSVQIS